MLLALTDTLDFLKKKQDVEHDFTVSTEIKIIWYIIKHLDILFL